MEKNKDIVSVIGHRGNAAIVTEVADGVDQKIRENMEEIGIDTEIQNVKEADLRTGRELKTARGAGRGIEKEAAVVLVTRTEKESEAGLAIDAEFQDGFSINSTNAEGFSGRIGDQNQLVNDSVSTSGRKSNFFSLGFYQQFFDVETDQVLKRILNSVVPTKKNFILDFVHPMPDLWGPFWISVTLVFSVGVFGNIAQYIENEGASGNYGSDFRLVTSSATLVFLYVVLVPVIVSAILWQRKSELQYAVSDLLCAYGYSLSIFVPVSILWTLDVNWFRWALIVTAVSLSGAVLAKSLWPAFKSDPNKLVLNVW
ncbi:Yip1 domain protein [Oesophagostomum dentatum]|uniref:Protein YIPF n=1 Tax=Oesophagostomum dentatum TaxID=61180 RepID=A0A0B1TL91_OESDE|nr:Yip1 domain protein [Oesophagostomum dentatum]